MKYYAVCYQDQNEIFTSWDACKEFITGKKGVRFKGFSTIEEANQFLTGTKDAPMFDLPTAYIDGSYDAKTGRYSFGGVLLIDGVCKKFSKSYDPDEYSDARNVAGEIKGAGFIISYAIHNGIKELNIIYDYMGIEKWFTGEWKASSAIAKSYVEFRNQVKNQIKVHFIKVKSHTNNTYNDMADQLAKKALGI